MLIPPVTAPKKASALGAPPAASITARAGASSGVTARTSASRSAARHAKIPEFQR